MASATINWTPAGGSSTGQRIEYRQKTVGGSWTAHATVSSTTNTATVNSLTDNVIYEFRIVNLCSGGEIASTNIEAVKLNCVTRTISTTSNSATVSFPHLGGDVSKYTVKIKTASSVLITSVDKLGPFTTGGTVSHTFTGLSASTSYIIDVSIYAGTFSNVSCSQTDILTSGGTCAAPTSVSATLT